MSTPPDCRMLLNTVVSTMGGRERAGQLQMAQAVEAAVDTQRHLLVQAGTGTGKSLAYLVPAVAHAFATGKPAVVATATLALQSQIVDGDLPRLAEALRPTLGREPTCVLVKGRRNYVCRYKTDGGLPDDDEGTLLSVGEVDKQSSWLGKEVLRLREWAGQTDSGDRTNWSPVCPNVLGIRYR